MVSERTLSIILPVFNVGTCLRATMDSLVGQTYEAFEIICIDDGSTDDSPQILQEYAACDQRVKVVSQANAGQGAARNRGLDLATGEYVLLLDADDVYEADFVEKMMARATTVDADIVVCRAVELDDSTGKVRPAPWTVKVAQLPTCDPFNVSDMHDFIFTAFVGWPWDKMFRRAFLVEHDLRFPDLANSEDLHFVFLALVRAQRISFLDEVLIQHRVGRAGSVSNSRKRAPMAFYEAICLLKDELRKDAALYEKLSWGLLNWAFDYTLWNIESMDDPETQRLMLGNVMDGHCPELELFAHSKPFFSLEVSDRLRLRKLLRQTGLGGDGRKADEAHAWLHFPVAFLDEARVFGFRKAFGKVMAKLRNRGAAQAQRGRLYFEDAAQIAAADGREGERSANGNA